VLLTPRDPIAAIVDAFRTHQLVALGEGPHGNEQGHTLLLSILRDERVQAVVNDVLVEFGAGFHQDTIDRFLLRGEDVPDRELQRVWRDTFRLNADTPVYERFYREMRRINMARPAGDRIRVLLSDPPISWDTVTTREAFLAASGDRDAYPAGLLEREVLAQGRRALLVYGDGHFQRIWESTIVGRIERTTGTRVFTIAVPGLVNVEAVAPSVQTWSRPSLALLTDTALGRMHWTVFDPAIPSTAPGVPQARLDEVFDALIYLGPRSALTFSRLDPALCGDEAYVRTRLSRLALAHGLQPGGSGASVPLQLKECDNVAR
jgi:hypothetical protein